MAAATLVNAVRCSRCSNLRPAAADDWAPIRKVPTIGGDVLSLTMCPACIKGEEATPETHDRSACSGKYSGPGAFRATCSGGSWRRTCDWTHTCWDEQCCEEAADDHAEEFDGECHECGSDVDHQPRVKAVKS